MERCCASIRIFFLGDDQQWRRQAVTREEWRCRRLVQNAKEVPHQARTPVQAQCSWDVRWLHSAAVCGACRLPSVVRSPGDGLSRQRGQGLPGTAQAEAAGSPRQLASCSVEVANVAVEYTSQKTVFSPAQPPRRRTGNESSTRAVTTRAQRITNGDLARLWGIPVAALAASRGKNFF